MNKIKAVLFDMDGVLVDAKEWHYKALNKALSLFGLEINEYEHLTTYDGLPTKEKLKMLSMKSNFPLELHPFINELKQQYTMDIIFQQCKPTFIHEYALSKLSHHGYKIAVCSNSVKKTVEIMMQKTNLEQYLEFFLSNEDVKNAKPDPEIYNLAINTLKLNPQDCLIIEDNINGIKAARKSGAYVLEVKTVNEVNYFNIKNKIESIEKGE